MILDHPPQLQADAPRRTLGQVRCAIYTRKSTEEGLDQDFNSLEAQRDAAEAFIVSQRGEGLVALPERYDDGGFSGASIDRPALERLLADIRVGAIECVVVYKVDRLSRSLIDFARIVEIFEKHNVSFVSVTQQFNTTNSLGRLTLNILLSFAQFEREIIAERTRDKISAARRKGKWIGGRPVLGYDIDPRGGRLTVNADEALQVRTIYNLYMEYNALVLVAQEVDRRGWRNKQWITRKGATRGGKPFTKGGVFRLLRNPIYVGKINFKKQIYSGEHEAIVESSVWSRTKEALERNSRNGGIEVRNAYCALLKELLHCTFCGSGMISIYRTKDSRRYRHYVCAQAHQSTCVNRKTRSVSEAAVMAEVYRQIRGLGSDPRIAARAGANAEEQRRSRVADLDAEREATERVAANLEAQARTLSPRGPCHGRMVTDGMTELQTRILQMERRLAEIQQELIRSQSVDESDLCAVLAQFECVWESLNSREQARIIRILVERIVYNGKTNRVTVSFQSPAIREMCRCTSR